jgi:N-acetylglucosaminyl-diphospho-decaprenol L-rhamnosyltransferase
MTLPVVIVSYNTAALLRQCLAALLQSEGPSLDIWVVDNGSRDGTVEMLRAEYPTVRLLPQAQNLGFAAANNVALRAMGFSGQGTRMVQASAATTATHGLSPEFVLLLNPDAEVQPAAIVTLLDFMRSHPRAGMTGAQLIYPDGRFQHSAFHFPGISQTFLDLFPLNHRLMDSRLNGRYPRRRSPFAVDHPLGACMLVRADAIQEIGLLDEGYFMYVEEVDWCRRLRRAGWEVWCEPRALVVHHEAQSTRQFREAMYVQLWRSRDRYFRSYHGAAYMGLIHTVVRLGLSRELRRLNRDPVMSADERARWRAALAEVKEQFT